MLSQTAEHALRAVLFLARQPGGRPIPADVIAHALQAPRNYLGKTLHVLARAGIVEGFRGPTGGFRLAVAADALTLERVVEPFAEARAPGMCLLGGVTCDPHNACAAHARWTALSERALAGLRETTVAQLLEGCGAAAEVSNGGRPGMGGTT